MEEIEGPVMTSTQLWYLFVFAWGIACAWALVKGLE